MGTDWHGTLLSCEIGHPQGWFQVSFTGKLVQEGKGGQVRKRQIPPHFAMYLRWWPAPGHR